VKWSDVKCRGDLLNRHVVELMKLHQLLQEMLERGLFIRLQAAEEVRVIAVGLGRPRDPRKPSSSCLQLKPKNYLQKSTP